MIAASIQSTEVFSLPSERTGEVHQIYLAFPGSYFSHPTQAYPVVYTIDANIAFEAVVGLARLMQLGGRIPEFVVVGIGYPLAGKYGDGLGEFFQRRARDLTSTTDERYGRFIADAFAVDGAIETGGSEQFLGLRPTGCWPVALTARRSPDSSGWPSRPTTGGVTSSGA